MKPKKEENSWDSVLSGRIILRWALKRKANRVLFGHWKE
jgi:hypothetical protein